MAWTLFLYVVLSLLYWCWTGVLFAAHVETGLYRRDENFTLSTVAASVLSDPGLVQTGDVENNASKMQLIISLGSEPDKAVLSVRGTALDARDTCLVSLRRQEDLAGAFWTVDVRWILNRCQTVASVKSFTDIQDVKNVCCAERRMSVNIDIYFGNISDCADNFVGEISCGTETVSSDNFRRLGHKLGAEDDVVKRLECTSEKRMYLAKKLRILDFLVFSLSGSTLGAAAGLLGVSLYVRRRRKLASRKTETVYGANYLKTV